VQNSTRGLSVSQLLSLADAAIDRSVGHQSLLAQVEDLRAAWDYLFAAISVSYSVTIHSVDDLSSDTIPQCGLSELYESARPNEWLHRLFFSYVESPSVIASSSENRAISATEVELIRQRTLAFVALFQASFIES